MNRFLFTAAVVLWLVPSVHAETIHFLVAELPGMEFHNESYVLPLNDSTDISHARRLIDEGPGIGQIIVHAGISPGPDGINRNHLAPGKPEWSWHVSEFLGFNDVTVEILDGRPSQIEEDIQGWFNNTDGHIGFWGFTVVEELTRNPGDANYDGVVDDRDFDIWLENRFTHSIEWTHGDFNRDGFVDVRDFNIWNVNRSGNMNAVPEPASSLLFVLGLFIVAIVRRGH